MTQKSEIEKIRDTLRWAIAIMITLLVILIGGAVRVEIRIGENTKDIQVIRDDYIPLFVLDGIVGSNEKYINIIQVLPSTTRDDVRYMEAIKDRNEFQREILSRASLSKRGERNGTGSD